ncbi:helix-turn-helix domain-containing protein [Antrihabitans stalactiti]
MRALVARELAGIDGLDANSQRLRETLHAYIRNLNSPDAAARSLGVHKNTVRYRIQRIEELLGHDIASRRVQLEVALECVAVYGPAVL